MKVVLLKDVKDIGRAHETVTVADGHGLNFLIPRKLAVAATARALQEAGMRLKQKSQEKEMSAKMISERLAALADAPLVLTKKANEKEHLYDAVDAKEIAEAAGLPEEAIKLEKPIKELGTFDIPIAFGEDFGKISIRIEAE